MGYLMQEKATGGCQGVAGGGKWLLVVVGGGGGVGHGTGGKWKCSLYFFR